MSRWNQMMQESEAKAAEAFDRMKAAQASGNRRAENKAWREHQKHREDAARFRAMANPMEVKAEGFKS